MGFSMMPGLMTFAVIVGAIGGFIDGWQKIKKQKKNRRRLNMTLDDDAWDF